NLRDPGNHWYGLSQRTRVIVYNPKTVDQSKLKSYEDLSQPEWANRICVRSSSNIYNQSLLASMIAHSDSASAEAWAKSVRGNMARKPQGNDRAQIKAVAAGECDVAIVNSYYLGVMLNGSDAEQLVAAQAVELLYPNQEGRGTHVNISGAGVTKHAPNKENAIKLLEFLAGDEAQGWYAETNNEYPAVAGVPLSKTVASWGEFKADELPVAKLGELNAEAVRAFDRAGWE
ncbi:MAG: extracellular solute-binding protein, partial [Granulosicoccaceae bacterium]